MYKNGILKFVHILHFCEELYAYVNGMDDFLLPFQVGAGKYDLLMVIRFCSCELEVVALTTRLKRRLHFQSNPSTRPEYYVQKCLIFGIVKCI